jgi:hypothetical protein
LALAHSLQAAIPQDLMGQVTDMPPDVPAGGSTGGPTASGSAMEVDGNNGALVATPPSPAATAATAAAHAKSVAEAADAAAQALRIQTAEAAQAAAIAKKEATKLAAEADGFVTVGKDGKPVAS